VSDIIDEIASNIWDSQSPATLIHAKEIYALITKHNREKVVEAVREIARFEYSRWDSMGDSADDQSIRTHAYAKSQKAINEALG